MSFIKKWSNVIGPLPWNELNLKFVANSQKLFLQTGLLRTNGGFATLGPILVRSLRKLETLVRKNMDEISAQEILLPTMTDSSLLEASGRLRKLELFTLKNFSRNTYVLGATYEEEITNLLASVKVSYKQIPCRLYQISNKFRDEKRVKPGLLRSKEFVMKDLYCFEMNSERNEAGYQEILKKYHEFFDILKIPYVCADSPLEKEVGLKSNEFHYLTEAGEDKIMICHNCGHIENCETDTCHKCSSKNIELKNGIEVGHAFNLGTTYSKPLSAFFINKEAKPELLHLCSFGLGLTRILGASAEILSSQKNIKWPFVIAPYLVCVIPPKEGSNEETSAKNIPEIIYHNLRESLNHDVVYFDIMDTSVGKRLNIVKQIGFPFAVLIGKRIKEDPPIVEVFDNYSNTVDFLQVSDVTPFILKKILEFSNETCLKKQSILTQ